MKCITAPIAVLDSGVGGIGVLRELQKALPAESFLYFGDCANAPYGEKTRQEIQKIVLARAMRLLCRAKALVLACNTATSVAAAELRARTELPVIGMEPALAPALRVCPRPRVLVLATEATLEGGKFRTAVQKAEAAGGSVTALAAPGMVRFAEAGVFWGEAPEKYLTELLAPYRGVRFDAVVLGCTHFPFLSGALHRALGYPVPFFDGAAGTAKETVRRLAAAGLLRGATAGADFALTIGNRAGANIGTNTAPDLGTDFATPTDADFISGNFKYFLIKKPPRNADPGTNATPGIRTGSAPNTAAGFDANSVTDDSASIGTGVSATAAAGVGTNLNANTAPNLGTTTAVPRTPAAPRAPATPCTPVTPYAPATPCTPAILRAPAAQAHDLPEPLPPAWYPGRVLITGSDPEKLPLMQKLYRFRQEDAP